MLLRTTALVLLVIPLALACSAETDDGSTEDRGETQSEVISSAPKGTTLQTTARLNLREEASSAAGVGILLTMPKGATVTTIDAAPKNGFFHVSYKGDEGWASGAYLTRAGAAAPEADDDTDAPKPTGFNGKTFEGVTMKWEGDYDYLSKCDPPFGATFSCDGKPLESFVTNGAWIAVPHAHFPAPLKKGQLSPICGKSARVCKGAKCITAVVMDRGSGTAFEGSTPVLKALGVTAGAKGCDSFGTATDVTVTLE